MSRILTYAIVLGILPIFFAGYQLYQKRAAIHEIQMQMESVQQQSIAKKAKQATNLDVRAHFRGADHFYIDQYIESIPLLEKEKEALEKVLDQQYLIENEAAKKRTEYLHNNRLSFSEGVVQSYPYFHETTETLTKPVEVDVSDLLEILSRIEGVDIGPYSPGPNRPQLIITDFRIDKKKTGENNEVFVLNLKLLKREFF